MVVGTCRSERPQMVVAGTCAGSSSVNSPTAKPSVGKHTPPAAQAKRTRCEEEAAAVQQRKQARLDKRAEADAGMLQTRQCVRLSTLVHTVLPVRGDAVPTGEAQAVPDVRRHQIARLPQGAVCRGTPASAAYLPGAGGISQGLPMEGEVLCQCQAPHRVWGGSQGGSCTGR